MAHMRHLFGSRINIWHVLGVAASIGLWAALSAALGEARVPSPTGVAQAIYQSVTYSSLLASRFSGGPTILNDLQYTVIRSLSGIVVGGLAGIAWGLFGLMRPGFGRVMAVPLEILRILPPLVVIPFFLMWLGPSSEAQFFVICFYAFVRLVVLTSEAARNVQPVLMNFSMTMGASRWQALRTVILPAITPELAGGMRVVLAEAWGLQIVAELLGSQAGIGQVLMFLLPSLRVDYMVATTFWLTIVAVGIDALIFVPVAARLTRWVPRTEGVM